MTVNLDGYYGTVSFRWLQNIVENRVHLRHCRESRVGESEGKSGRHSIMGQSTRLLWDIFVGQAMRLPLGPASTAVDSQGTLLHQISFSTELFTPKMRVAYTVFPRYELQSVWCIELPRQLSLDMPRDIF